MTSSMYFSNQDAIKNEWLKWQKFASIISRAIAIFMKLKYINSTGRFRVTTTTWYVRRFYHLPQKEVLRLASYNINH